MHVFNDTGIFGARIAAWIFQGFTTAIGVYLCLAAMPTNKPAHLQFSFAFVCSLVLSIWVIPYYKVFDHGTSIAIVAMVVLLLASTQTRTWFFAGVILGLAALLGRNHGVYGAVAATFALAIVLAQSNHRRSLISPAAWFIIGTFLSYSPTFFMMVWVPGFKDAFFESVMVLLRSGATNIGLPIPWPWNFNVSELGWVTWAIVATPGIGFVLLLLVPAIALVALAKCRLRELSSAQRLLLASALTGIPYAHYAYSRADMTHLALAVFPLLLALLAIGILIRRPIISSLGVLAISVWAVSGFHPTLGMHLRNQPHFEAQVSGYSIYGIPDVTERLSAANAALARHPEAVGNFLALPDMPSLHAIHAARIPIWEIYSLSPRDANFENLELKKLIASPPKLILISNHALDRREEFRYSRMHPLIYAWVQQNYELEAPIAGDTTPGLEVYVPKNPILIH